MEVILLERIPRLGQMGDVVRVRDGYARNYLLPQGKALRSSETNRKRFEQEKTTLEARNLERRQEAEQVAEKLNGQTFTVIRQAGETGQLYGSVSTRDLTEVIAAAGFTVGRHQVGLDQPIKAIGMHRIAILLHPEVDVTVSVNVARSPDEAERQARGENLTTREEFVMEREVEDEAAEAAAARIDED